jgi:hypothetical protein
MRNKLNFFIINLIAIISFTSGQLFAADNTDLKEATALKSYNYQVATIAGDKSKLHLYKNDTVDDGFCPTVTDINIYTKDSSVSAKDCPAQKTECELKPNLNRGNKVIIIKQYKDFSCVWSPSKDGIVYGWIPTKLLKNSKPAEVTDSKDWLGKWYMPHTQINFSKGKQLSQLIIKGNSQWKGEGQGQVNTGELENKTVELNKNEATVNADGCQIYFRLVNRANLLAVDNGQCGGLNVSFGGLYTRVKR